MGRPNHPGWPAAPPTAVYTAAPPTNGMAIAALVLALFYPVGIVLGHVARGQIKRTGEGAAILATAALSSSLFGGIESNLSSVPDIYCEQRKQP